MYICIYIHVWPPGRQTIACVRYEHLMRARARGAMRHNTIF